MGREWSRDPGRRYSERFPSRYTVNPTLGMATDQILGIYGRTHTHTNTHTHAHTHTHTHSLSHTHTHTHTGTQ